MNSAMPAVPVTLGNKEYVILPRDEYERLAGIPVGSVDAVEYATVSIARSLRAARMHAGISQGQLAAMVGKSQAWVSGTESGRTKASEHYVAKVLKACRLPKDWKGAAEGGSR